MASLKEIKGRIASVGSTLKITSAMKMVASAKLHGAQVAIENMRPYESRLRGILAGALSSGVSGGGGLAKEGSVGKVAIVALASNSSLCGAFNLNIIKEALEVVEDYRSKGLPDSAITVYSIGRKMSEAMRKAGFTSPADYTKMSAKPDYESAAALAQELMDGFLSGRFDKVELVYSHFKSSASQPCVREVCLPLSVENLAGGEDGSEPDTDKYIIEPDPVSLVEDMIPKVVKLKLYTTLLDSSAAEFAARTVAMQTATDNAQDLLRALTLEYNKNRQQRITSEILDIVSGTL